jgi:hypothetical protein
VSYARAQRRNLPWMDMVEARVRTLLIAIESRNRMDYSGSEVRRFVQSRLIHSRASGRFGVRGRGTCSDPRSRH